MLSRLWEFITSGVIRYVLPLLLLAALTYVAIRLVDWGANEFDKRITQQTADRDRRQRMHTLARVTRNTLRVAILVIAVLVGLGTVGVNIGPALAALGVVGLALSLGAQTLIKDIIGGVIILLEDQYRVGDSIKVGAVGGEVERITLRRTDLRDTEGRLYVVPNGDVRTVGNETREWSRALVELHFAYHTDLAAAVDALNRAVARVGEDTQITPHLLDAPAVLGWNQFDNWSVVIRVQARVLPGKQGDVARVIRRYALEELTAAGIAVESQSRVMLHTSGAAAPG
jgi:small conductance mechanosensitive channel